MHQSSYDEMRDVLKRHLGGRELDALTVLDVGSRSVEDAFGKIYRDHMPPAWTYRGADVEPGKNVDIVAKGPYRIQDRGETFDVVISGQCLEHVELPHLLVLHSHDGGRSLGHAGRLFERRKQRLFLPGEVKLHFGRKLCVFLRSLGPVLLGYGRLRRGECLVTLPMNGCHEFHNSRHDI